jgi:hypothetical protein
MTEQTKPTAQQATRLMRQELDRIGWTGATVSCRYVSFDDLARGGAVFALIRNRPALDWTTATEEEKEARWATWRALRDFASQRGFIVHDA